MLESLKRLTKHSAIYGLGNIITRMDTFLLLPLHTNKLSADDFGVSAILFMFIAIMTILYTYGIDAAFLRYFILSDDARKRREIFSTAFWGVAIFAIGLSILIYLKADSCSSLLFTQGHYPHLVRLASLILLFDAISFLPFLYLRAEEKSFWFIALKFLNVITTLSLNFYFIVILKKGLTGIFLANAWASGVTFLLILFILIKQVSLRFSWTDYKELLKFGLPYLPSTAAVILLDLIDRLLLERLVGLEVTGIYQAGLKLGQVMALFVAAFRFAWHPFFLSTSKQEDAKEIFAKILTYFTTFCAIIFLAISFFVDEIVRFNFFGVTLIGKEFWSGTQVVPLIIFSQLIYGMYVNFVVGIHLEKKTKFLPLITGAGLTVNVAVNLFLIPKIGMLGAGYAKVAGYIIMAGLLYSVSRRYYPISYEFKRLAQLAIVVAVLFYFGYS
ncbi:MAG: lipopolysaccharide biosynthesis protein, partial [bacterium]